MRLDTLYLAPRVQGAQKGARWDSGASEVHFGGNFIEQKLLGTPKLVQVGHLFGPQIQIWKDMAQCVSVSRRFYKIKVVVYVPNSAWPQGQANVWLSQHTFGIKSNLESQYYFNTYFESSRATPGNPS